MRQPCLIKFVDGKEVSPITRCGTTFTDASSTWKLSKRMLERTLQVLRMLAVFRVCMLGILPYSQCFRGPILKLSVLEYFRVVYCGYFNCWQYFVRCFASIASTCSFKILSQ